MLNKKLGSVLFVCTDENGESELSLRNIPNVKPIDYKYINAYDLMIFDSIVISKEAVQGIEGWWK